MGFFSNIISSAVKIALTPVAITKDVVNITIGVEPDATKELIKSAGEDLTDALDDLTGNSL